jgi:hypothetical protein
MGEARPRLGRDHVSRPCSGGDGQPEDRAKALAYWLGMFYTPPPGKERPGSRQRDPDKGKVLEEERPRKKELWEIGLSGASPEPEPIPEPVPEQPRRRQLRRPASRGGEAGTISVVRFLAQGPLRHTTVLADYYEFTTLS